MIAFIFGMFIGVVCGFMLAAIVIRDVDDREEKEGKDPWE